MRTGEGGSKRVDRREEKEGDMGRRRDGGSCEEEEEVFGCVSPAAGQT